MKLKLSLITVAISTLMPCNSNTSNTNKISVKSDVKVKTSNMTTTTNEKKMPKAETKVKYFTEVLKDAEKLKGKEVTVKGRVKHVCSHSGRRCFLHDSIEDVTIRVEASGKIKGFNREISGDTITVTGILQSTKITKERIEEMNKAYKKKNSDKHGHCASENNAITKMIDWMKKNKKDYYTIFYIKGQDYNLN